VSDLITLARAKQQIPNTPSADDSVLSSLITACSATVEDYCNRRFTSQDFDELIYGTDDPNILVANPPIIQVKAVRISPLPAIWITNTSSAVSVATVTVTSTAVVLYSVSSGTPTTVTKSFASYATFAALGANINTIGNGWSATVPDQFATWATADLTPQGAFGAKNLNASLLVYWWYLPFERVNYELGEIYAPGAFWDGYQTCRVQYTGGYATVPEEIQQATAELVQLVYASRRMTPGLASETLDRYSYSRLATTSIDSLSVSAKQALNYYKLTTIPRWHA
jgi:hypothetical protein